ncbi:MAG: Asp-tRNA(Asn)/Glu-tRNA(Gln) amidotransferase subunit GatB [Dehalococcoidia bacterium]
MNNKYETVIGLEVHSQLLTKSKMFCGCESDYQNAQPNSRVCPICMGMPGVLPVVNKKAVELIIKTGLAIGCSINQETKFDRKNYSYPDLMKGYQISQFDLPVAINGNLNISLDGNEKTIGVTRVHLEEDVARLIHKNESNGTSHSLIDINRAGVPLMEIVSEPDMRSPEEANEYLIQLHSIVRSIKASTANMEEGSFRCDANISMRLKGTTELGTKVEIKNVNSFRSVFRALQFEQNRQINLLEKGEEIVQETRGWSDESEKTVSQRIKEFAADYRYFPEPDLPPIIISKKWVDEIKSTIDELPAEKIQRFITSFKLSQYDSSLLISNDIVSTFFEDTLKECKNLGLKEQTSAKTCANLLNVDLPRILNEKQIQVTDLKTDYKNLAILIKMISEDTLNSTMAKTVFDNMLLLGKNPIEIAENLGLSQISDTDSLEQIISNILSNNTSAVQDYLEGKETAIRFLIGQVMKETKGKANPKIATEILINQIKKS